MLVFVCMLLPAVLLCCIWDRKVDKFADTKEHLHALGIASLGINIFGFLTVLLVRGNKIGFAKLFEQPSSATKYLLLTTFAAVAVPLGYKYFKDNFVFKYRILSFDSLRINWQTFLSVYAVLLLCLNLVRIFDGNFWGDEAFSIRLARMSMSDMVTATANDVHPPLYYAVLIACCQLLGQHEYVYHFVSVIPYGIVLFVALTKIRKEFGIGASFVLITLASLLPEAVKYNVEVRMYSWGALFLLLTYLALYDVFTKNRVRDWCLLLLFSLAAAYTHYYCLVSAGFLYLVLLFKAVWQKKNLGRAVLVSTAALAAYMPWLFILIASFKRTAADYWMTSVPSFSGCIKYLLRSGQGNFLLIIFIIVILAALLYESGIVRIESAGGKAVVRVSCENVVLTDYCFWVIAGLTAVLGTIVTGIAFSKVFRPMFTLRYIYPVAVLAWLLLGCCIMRCRGKQIYLLLVAVIAVFSLLPEYGNIYEREKKMNNDLHRTLQATQNIIGKNDVILTTHGHIVWTIAELYYPGVKCVKVDLKNFPQLHKGTVYWFMPTAKIDEKVEKEAAKQDFKAEKLVSDGNLGTNYVNVYKLVAKNAE